MIENSLTLATCITCGTVFYVNICRSVCLYNVRRNRLISDSSRYWILRQTLREKVDEKRLMRNVTCGEEEVASAGWQICNLFKRRRLSPSFAAKVGWNASKSDICSLNSFLSNLWRNSYELTEDIGYVVICKLLHPNQLRHTLYSCWKCMM